MDEKIYICECGKTFNKPNSFNGHKSHCCTHLLITNRKHIRDEVDKQNKSKISATSKINANNRKLAELSAWISEKHCCEKCHKIMTEKFGSGRFCSRGCANSHIFSTESLYKKNKSLSNTNTIKHNKLEEKKKLTYYSNPKYCIICNSKIPYESRTRTTCSNVCKNILIGIKSKESAKLHGGNNNVRGVRGTARYGTYFGFTCDSSFELAVVIYCLEHSIDIKRNTIGFNYVFNHEEHTYYPDFIINDVYVETKNYWTEQLQAKIDQFPKNMKYVILYYEDLKPCIDYCVEKYGNDFTKLYDRNYPSWMDKLVDSNENI